jgi:hypothetical protein
MDEMDEGSTTRSSQKEGDVGNGVGWGGGGEGEKLDASGSQCWLLLAPN